MENKILRGLHSGQGENGPRITNVNSCKFRGRLTSLETSPLDRHGVQGKLVSSAEHIDECTSTREVPMNMGESPGHPLMFGLIGRIHVHQGSFVQFQISLTNYLTKY